MVERTPRRGSWAVVVHSLSSRNGGEGAVSTLQSPPLLVTFMLPSCLLTQRKSFPQPHFLSPPLPSPSPPDTWKELPKYTSSTPTRSSIPHNVASDPNLY